MGSPSAERSPLVIALVLLAALGALGAVVLVCLFVGFGAVLGGATATPSTVIPACAPAPDAPGCRSCCRAHGYRGYGWTAWGGDDGARCQCR